MQSNAELFSRETYPSLSTPINPRPVKSRQTAIYDKQNPPRLQFRGGLLNFMIKLPPVRAGRRVYREGINQLESDDAIKKPTPKARTPRVTLLLWGSMCH